jgi:hypothetical protein
MSGLTELQQQLSGLCSQSLSRESPQTMSCEFAHGRCECEVVAADKLAAVFRAVEFRASAGEPLSAQALLQIGEDLSARLHYLLEPIAPIEIDGDGAVLQLRSVPPSEDGAKAHSYYEILVRQDCLSLKRYSAVDSQPRQPAEMTITHEILGRIFSDFAAAHAARL